MTFSRPRDGDAAASPVIAVVLMVGVTVVLSATVYVWVSDLDDTGRDPALLALSPSVDGNGVVTFSILQVSPGFAWKDLKVTVLGVDAYGIAAGGHVVHDQAWTAPDATGVLAGEAVIRLAHRDGATPEDFQVNFVDLPHGTVVATVPVRAHGDVTPPAITEATAADPSTVTFDEPVYTGATVATAGDVLTFTDGSGDGDALAGTPLTFEQGTRTVEVDLTGTPEATDEVAPHGTNALTDLAGNVWAAAYAWS